MSRVKETASRPVMPWMITLVLLSTRIDTLLALPDSPSRRLGDGDGAVEVLDAVAAQQPKALLFPGAGDAEGGDGLRRVAPRFHAALAAASCHQVDAGVVHHVHDDGYLLHARLGEDELGELGHLAHAGVASDLAVVGGPAAVAAHGVEGGEAGTAATEA